MKSEVFLMDCVEGMRNYSDDYFDLAVVDPPYGIGMDWKKSRKGQFYNIEPNTYKNEEIPSKEYFKQLFRVSKNQIIWGGNYYTQFLPAVNSWICWDKNRDVEKTFMSEGELAWTSFNVPFRFFRHIWDGGKKGSETGKKRIHPHQKPVALYDWTFQKYASQGMKILDTHLGSGSSRISADKYGLEFTGFEIDENYFKASEKRYKNYKAQLTLSL